MTTEKEEEKEKKVDWAAEKAAAKLALKQEEELAENARIASDAERAAAEPPAKPAQPATRVVRREEMVPVTRVVERRVKRDVNADDAVEKLLEAKKARVHRGEEPLALPERRPAREAPVRRTETRAPARETVRTERVTRETRTVRRTSESTPKTASKYDASKIDALLRKKGEEPPKKR
ncbi:MAG: hypothetical protein ACPHK8_07310 [Thermoplasmatota archaeon]